MAGDRGLAFVVIGLIGVSTFWVSNQRRIEPRPAPVRAAQIDSEGHSSAVNAQLQATTRDLSAGDTEETFYVFGMRSHRRGHAAVLGYPELSGPAPDTFSRFAQRLRLSTDAGIALPLD
jgi:hypothetical protein